MQCIAAQRADASHQALARASHGTAAAMRARITGPPSRIRRTANGGRGEKRPVVKLCSPYPRLFFFGNTKTLGVDSCVFLIFTTRVDQKNGSTLVKLILFEKSRLELEFVFSIFTSFLVGSKYSVFSNSWQILKTEAGTKRNLRIQVCSDYGCVC